MDRLLLDVAIKGTLVLFLAAAVARASRDRSAAVRHLVWSVALGSLAALPLLSVALPEWSVTIPSVRPAVATAVSAPAREGFPWARVVVLAWLAGAGFVTVVTAIGRVRLAWLTRGSEDLDHGSWPALANRIADEMGVARRVRLRIVDRETMPMVWGVLRPVVLLPASAASWSGSLRRHVLLHELAHVKRGDCLIQIVSRVALAVHWFNPLAWIAARRLRLERERACDDHVLGYGADACDYAEDLVGMARRLRPSRGSALALGMADPSRFGDRVIALLDAGRRRRDLTRRATLFAGVLTAVVVLPLAAARPCLEIAGRVDVADLAGTGPAPVAERPVPERTATPGSDGERRPPGRAAAVPRPAPERNARSAARAIPTAGADPIEGTVERGRSAIAALEANTTRGIPRPGIARVEYRRSSGAGEAPGSWTSTHTKASETCEEEERGAPARPARLASTAPETATP